MKNIEINKTEILTRTGAYLRLDKFDVPLTDEHTPVIVGSNWIDPDKAALILSQVGRYDELSGFFSVWHKLPQTLRNEWAKSQQTQNPYGGINPGIVEVENILRES